MGSKSSPAACRHVVGKLVRKVIDLPLSDEERNERAEEAARLEEVVGRIEARLSQINKRFNRRVRDLTAERKRLQREYKARVAPKEVECIEHLNFEAQMVEYWHASAKVSERIMTDEDRQLDLGPNP